MLLKIKRFIRKKIDSRFQHIIFLPTLKCNYNCPYCILKQPTYQKRYAVTEQAHWAEWERVLNAMPHSIIGISGGEPFLYPHIEELINSLSKKHRVSLVTNLSQKLDRFFELVKPPLSITVSFHPHCADRDEVSEKIKLLTQKGYSIGVNTVAYPEIIPRLAELHEHFTRKVGVRFHIDPFVNSPYPNIYTEADLEPIKHLIDNDRTFFTSEQPPSLKRCMAGEKYFIFFPDGEGYACFAGYYHNPENFSIGNIIKGTFKPLHERRLCKLSCVEGCDLNDAVIDSLEKTVNPDEKNS